MQRCLAGRIRDLWKSEWAVFTLIMVTISVVKPALSQTQRQELPLKDLSGFQGQFSAADFDSVGLDSFIVDYMTSHHIPGLAAVIIKESDFIYSGEFGNAYNTPQLLVSDSTLFMLASISKTITATALMQLYDQGYFNLDDAVNDYLPFQVNHPGYPSTAITFRMLLTHTSGIRDNWFVMDYYPGDSPIPLGEYLSNYLVPGGAYYYAPLNFAPWAPGAEYEYCNNAIALVGYLVEVISGQDFSQYCQADVFPVVDMYESSFRFADLDSMRMAQPMSWNGNSYSAYPHFGYSDYPSGSLRTSAIQLARFLSSYMHHGQYGVNTVLDSSTVAEMLSPQIPQIDPSQGLVWYNMNLGGRQIWGHGGGDLGVTTEMYFCPDQNSGVVLLTNGESFFYDILDACFDYAQSYAVFASLDLTPHDPPIIIPASGGNFQFDVAIDNLDDLPILFDFWIDVTTP
ncbi:beta-lactamase family protein [bacterium]|nr:beta-lactamase family protein [bacterium]